MGDVDDGLGAVADAFRANFTDHHEIGAACAVYRDRRKIVDLWGGYRDGHIRAPWEENTIVPVASTTKGMAAMAVAVAWGGELYAGGEAGHVYRIDQSGNVAQIARLEGFVAGVTLDGMGNLYVCDTGNGRGVTDPSISGDQHLHHR